MKTTSTAFMVKMSYSLERSLTISIMVELLTVVWYLIGISYFISYLHKQGIILPMVLLKVLIIQLVMAPRLNTLFFGYVILTKDRSRFNLKVDMFKKKLKTDLLPTIKRSCVFWSIVQFYDFLFLPSKFQLLYINVAFMFWTTYISFVGHRVVKSWWYANIQLKY